MRSAVAPDRRRPRSRLPRPRLAPAPATATATGGGWSPLAVGMVFAVLFLAAVNIGLANRVGTEDVYQAEALVVIEYAPSFSVARTPRSLVGLVRDSDDPLGRSGRLIEPIEGTPLARVQGRGDTPGQAGQEADRRAAFAVAELNRLGDHGFRARVVTEAGPATTVRTRPSRPQLMLTGAMAAGALTLAAMLTSASRRAARRRPLRPVWSSA